jgi:hypothetical protein
MGMAISLNRPFSSAWRTKCVDDLTQSGHSCDKMCGGPFLATHM